MQSRRHRSPVAAGPAALIVALIALSLTAGASAQDAPVDSSRARFIRPAVALSWTTGVPDARGDRAGHSGVGPDLWTSAGVRGRLGALQFAVRPEVLVNGNRAHQTFGTGDPARNAFASPFYHGHHSADLPSRPGDGTLVQAALGESGLWWTDGAAFVGVLSAQPTWGGHHPTATPGDPFAIGEGLVLGRSAPGVPRLELARSWQVGREESIRLRWLGGMVRESRWFDDRRDNDTRLLSGARVEFSHAGILDAGFSRTVMSAAGRPALVAAMQPFWKAAKDSTIEFLAADLIYRAPDAGTMAWFEVARQAPVTGPRRFFRFPTEGVAFRVGLSQRIRRSDDAEWAVAMEIVRLDQAGTSTDVEPNDAYTSESVIHGWTHRGQPLGSGLGPGGQRQLLRVERLGRTWDLAAFAERARRNEDALLRESAPSSDRHDVTLTAGLMASRRMQGYDVGLQVSVGKRFNYLFQGPTVTPDGEPVDIGQLRMGLTVAPTSLSRVVGVFPQP